MAITTTSIHERIKLLRTQKGMTMQELADAIGKKRKNVIFRWEEDTIPKIDSIKKLAIALDTTVEYLINGEGGDRTK